jgi:hypothetical protein
VNPYVFPGINGRGHLIEPMRQMKKVIESSGVSFMAHDLHRTFITVAESPDISMYAIKCLVDHKFSNDVTAGYIVFDVERLRHPIQRITNTLLRYAHRKQEFSTYVIPVTQNHNTDVSSLSLV